MKFIPKASRLFLITLGLMFLVGCTESPLLEVVDEEDETSYRRAKQLISRGKNNEALESLLKLIQHRNGNAPESHLESGRLYLYHIKDPFSAIYHFNRYSTLQAGKSNDSEVKQKLSLVDDLKKTAMKEVMTSFEAKVYQDPLERMKLMDTIEQLRAENEEIKNELVESRRMLRDSGFTVAINSPQAIQSVQREVQADVRQEPIRPNRVDPEPATQSGARTYYTVQRGDTFSSISRKFYGTVNRYKDIMEANSGMSATQLKVGSSIVIPE
ncbi:LysM peptidoglycan-binding domain-containing protein [Puniceicoccaceae bacterium K14]|nr:LysM peptidoglycan-binding domain-containing protein [Puniceicoccaceae bacterium K14]